MTLPPQALTVVDTADQVARAAGGIVGRLAQEAVQRRGRFVVALSGGSTPERFYRLLADEAKFRDAIPWSNMHV